VAQQNATLRKGEKNMQTCSIYRHEHREEIDKALIAEEPLRNIAKRTGTSETGERRGRGRESI
jgi:hypothetical protein